MRLQSQPPSTDHPLMSLTLQDMGRIANLARLELDEAHAQSMLARLNGFLTCWFRAGVCKQAAGAGTGSAHGE